MPASNKAEVLILSDPFNEIPVRIYTGSVTENLINGKPKYLNFFLVTDDNGVKYYCEDFDTMCRLETETDFSSMYVRIVEEGRVIGFQNWPKR